MLRVGRHSRSTACECRHAKGAVGVRIFLVLEVAKHNLVAWNGLPFLQSHTAPDDLGHDGLLLTGRNHTAEKPKRPPSSPGRCIEGIGVQWHELQARLAVKGAKLRCVYDGYVFWICQKGGTATVWHSLDGIDKEANKLAETHEAF